jgi:hypothetical protein
VEGLWSPSLVGRVNNPMQKPTVIQQRYFSAERGGVFLSQAGPRFDLELVKLSITSGVRMSAIASRNDEGDPVGSPSTGLVMPLAG